jgi:hypothetical protein
MKVKVVANELVDTDIEMVSLVRHGANRCPFKVLKSEDDEPASLGDKFQSFFSLAKGDVAVSAYFIRKDAADKLLPILKAEGVDTSNVSETEGVVRVQVSEAAPKGFVQLGDALAVAINQPLKEFSEESVVKAYADSGGPTGFAPSVNLAVAGLADAVWSLLNSGEAEGSREERVAKVDSMLASFRKYITSLAKTLPEQVFKVEAAARAAQTEEADMPKGKLEPEAVAGDLDGLSDTVTKTEATSLSDTTTDTVVLKAEEAPSEAPAPEAPPADLSAVLKALEAINAKVDGFAKTVDEIRTSQDSLAALVAETTEPVEKAEAARRTTVVDAGGDMDLALSTLGGSDTTRGRPRPVVKTDEEMWGGLFSGLDTFRPSR